ncbi:hypothetical protein H9X78_11200 [Clostridium saudiense]|nr:hypothetical protein [Clostridium saudiense]
MNLSYDILAKRLDEFLYEFSLLNSEVNSLRKRICLLENKLRSKEEDV